MYQSLLIFVLVAIFLFAGCYHGGDAHGQKPIIVAHRGASYVAPENTAASTVLAFEKGADASEIDVYLSKDSRIMVIHDDTTKRTSGVDLKVAETDSATLRTLDVGSFRSKAYAGEKIPFFEEVIAVVPEGKMLVVEIKCGTEVVPYLKKAIEDSGKKDRIAIISFNLDVVLECKKMMPTIPLYWLVSTEKDEKTGQFPPYDVELITRAAAEGLTGLNLCYAGLTEDFVKKTHKAGLEVFVWTVDDVETAKTMQAYGVDGITTNKPDVMKAELRR
jgi:glycerophosphoryl diester phosphodiesterase